jgi:hypothetical protein
MNYKLLKTQLAARVVAIAVSIVFMLTATAFAQTLNCKTYSSDIVACPYNTWTNVEVDCPTNRVATGGGYYIHEGSLGVPNIWLMTYPTENGWRTWVDNQNAGNRYVQTYVRCCKVKP